MTPPTIRFSLPVRARLLLVVFVAAFLSGCGGGGASLPASTTPVIDGFTANGAAVVFSGATVPVVAAPTNSLSTFVCTAHDPDHSPLTFSWTGINGAIATQTGSSTAGDTPTADGDTLVTCTVTNVRGDSVSRTITLRATGTPTTALSLALSPASGVISRGGTDLLTAVVTGTGPFTYQFAIASGTGTVAASTSNPAQATFTAPAVAESDIVSCSVINSQGRSASATAIILVQ